jgi:hypothetical protein
LEFRGVLTVYCSINFRSDRISYPAVYTTLVYTPPVSYIPHTVSTTQSQSTDCEPPQKQNASGCHPRNAQAVSPLHRRSAQARARPSHVHRILIYSVARPHASRTAHRIYYSITATSPRALSHRRTRHCNSTDTVTESQLRRAAAHLMFSILCVPPKARKTP